VLAELAAFAGVAALVICTPGQDTALTIRSALAGGRRAGIATAAGVAIGQAAWTVATAIGLASLLVASQPVFLALRLAGAVVLVVLGVQLLVTAMRRRTRHGLEIEAGPRVSPCRAFRQGLLSNLANPKMAVFFTSLLPQFAPTSGPAFPVLLGLGLLFCTMTFVWLAAYSVAVGWARRMLLRERVRRSLDAVTGAVLVAFGVRLAATRP
jgi:threonine/homoserine/homoserine lactone efflux protein